jgi:hypothetical protein
MLASTLAGRDAVASESACAVCTSLEDKWQVNRVVVSLAIAVVPSDGETFRALVAEHGHLIRRAPAPQSQRLAAVLAGTGPGSQLWHLFADLGVAHRTDCACLGRAEQMNRWGVAGCRLARAEIVQWMQDGSTQYGWGTVVTAAAKAVFSGLAFRLSLADPYGSLVDEAIRLASEVDHVPDLQA